MFDPYKAFEQSNPFKESMFATWQGIGLSVALDYSFSKPVLKWLQEGDRAEYAKKLKDARARIGAKSTPRNLAKYSSTPNLIGPLTSSQAEAARLKYNRSVLSRFTKQNPKPNFAYSNIKSMMRSATLIGTMAFVADVAFQALKPGISKVAERNEAKLLEPLPGDSPGAYTQRQRAIMAIHDSQLGIRNVIGSEAGYFHK